MIDLSFLTDEEQEAILKVLQRDADLKRAEEDRVRRQSDLKRHLPEKIKDDSQIKNMSGQWFYEAKARRHRERIHGADIIRASMRRKPLTTEPNRNKSGGLKNSWVNNVNKEQTELFGAIEEESKSSQSSKVSPAAADILDKPQEDARKMTASPSKQRKNPFNDSALPEDNKLPENGMTDLSEASKKDTLLPSVESPSKVKFPNDRRVGEPQQALVDPNDLPRQAGKPPVPKARKNLRKISDVRLESDDSFSKGPGRVKQINGQGVAEKSPPAGEVEGFSQNSLEKLKQVRFSSSVGRKERPQSLELHEGKESGEFSFIDSDYVKTSDNQVGGLDALPGDQALPVESPRSHSPALNGRTEDRGGSREGGVVSGSYGSDRSDPPSSALLSEESPIVEPATPAKASSKISSSASEKQTPGEAHPQVKAQQLSPGPEGSKNITGQPLPLAKSEDPQVPSLGSSTLDQGKPALVEGQTAKASSKSDRHAAEILKAADESISKVLDWFQRSSSTGSKADVPKIKEDDGSNFHSSLCEKEDLTNKDHQAHESISQPGKFSFANNKSPGRHLLEEQRLCSDKNVKGVVDSSDQGEDVHGRERACFQTTDQESNKGGETNVWGETATRNQRNVTENVYQEPKDFEDSRKIQLALKSVDSSIKVMERKNSQKPFVERKGGVESSMEEENFEHQAHKGPEDAKESSFLHEGTRPGDTTNTNPELLSLQQKVKPPSPNRDQKRVKDIRAFWESEKTTPKLPDRGQPRNNSTPVSNVIQSNTKRSSTIKPLGGSSGYATAESDNEQGKYSLVSFRKVHLSDDDSEPTENDSTLTLEKTRPSPIGKFKESHIDKSGKIPPSNQMDSKSTKLLDADNLHTSTGFSSQEDGGLQAIASEKEKSPSTLQQKPTFEIHSLKERIDEESKDQRLDPSRFKSLRSFWDVGTRPQNETEEVKGKRVIPNSNTSKGSSWKDSMEIKGVTGGTDRVVLEDEQQNRFVLEDGVKQPNAKMSPQREASWAIPRKGGQEVLSPATNSVPPINLELLGNNSESSSILKAEEKRVPPVEEYFEKIVMPSKVQHGLFSSLQKMMEEAYQESLPGDLAPSDEKGAPKVEEQICYTDRTPQQGAVPADTVRSTELSANEVVETVNRTLIQPDTDTFHARMERLLKEAKPSPSPLKVEDISEQEVSPSERMSFFKRVMERSHEASPSNHKKSGLVSQGTRQKYVSSLDPPIEFKPGFGNLSRETEDSNSVVGESSKGRIYPEGDPSQKSTFQIPSPSPMLSDAQLAAQSRVRYPGKEVSESVTETSVPSKRECHDLNTKLLILLKESTTMPCVSPTAESILKSQFHTIPASPQMACPARVAISETTDRSVDTDEDDGSRLTTVQGEPVGETARIMPLKNQKIVRAQLDEKVVSAGEPDDQRPNEVAETVVKTAKPNSWEHIAFKNNLSKLLKEDYQVLSKATEILKSTHASLQPDQHACSVLHADTAPPKEINEMVAKATAPSNFRYTELKANLEKLLQPDSEILPSSQKSTDYSNKEHVGFEHNRTVDLAYREKMGRGQEMDETVIQNIAPSKLKGSKFNSGLWKLLEEDSRVPSLQLTSLDAKMKLRTGQDAERAVVLPQEADEIVVKSVAPTKDATAFRFSLGKLIKGSSDASLQLSQESQKVLNDSAFLLEKKSLHVNMPTPVESMSSGYRSEVKIPLKGRTSKQEEQAMEEMQGPVVPERKAAFQKILQGTPASAEAHPMENYLILARVDARENQNRSEREAEEVPNASTFLDDGSEKVNVLVRSQRSSTPIKEKENTPPVNKVELLTGSPGAAAVAAGEEEEEEAISFDSDLSKETRRSSAGIQRSSACSEEELNPVLEALKRSSNRQIPSKSLEDIPSATSNKGKVNLPKEDLMLSAEDDQEADQTNENAPGAWAEAEDWHAMMYAYDRELKQVNLCGRGDRCKSDRETDSASDSSYPLGRIKKSPSSLTNLSGSSGLASLSSVSTSVMSIYSGDFGNVDVKGNVQFAIDYVEQLKELHIFIAQCKDLAVVDVKKQRSDPYVKCYLLPEKYKLGKRKTSVKKKTLNPVFNEILRYKVDKTLLAYQRLNLSVWHNDTFGRNSFLGEVELDLGLWDWDDKQNKQMNWYSLKPRTPLDALELENRGEMKLALQYVPTPPGGKKTPATGEVHIWVKECNDLPILKGSRLNSFVKCTILPDTSRKSCQKTRAVAKTTNPVFNHTMVYDGFRPEDLKEACVELTVWDHNKLVNRFLGGLRIGLGIGKSYGTAVDWMDSTLDEIRLWEKMINSPNKWVEDTLPLRMLTIAKMTK
ncbi:hypothetical protein lerEdw1_005854 [Lerista edwardsae]|nr:hypothetical protein lerEdw1_005854 [Lerista edwardsae]